MELSLEKVPKQALDAAIWGFKQCQSDQNTQILTNIPTFGKEYSIACEHPVYYVSRQSVLSGRSILSGKFAGWRFMILLYEEAVAEIDVVASRYLNRKGPIRDTIGPIAIRHGNSPTKIVEHPSFTFAKLSQGPLVESTVKAIQILESLDTKTTGSLHLIRVPELHLHIIWIRGEKDVLMPISSLYDDINVFTVYQTNELQKLIYNHMQENPQSGKEIYQEEQ